MTKLLTKAFERASQLPSGEQDVLAQRLFEDLSRNGNAARGRVPALGVDKTELRHCFDEIFSKMGIPKEPVAIEEIQELARQSDLEPNELSRDLIAARER